MAHAQKPDSVFQRNGRVHLYRRGCQFSRVLAFLECGSGENDCSNTGWTVPSQAEDCLVTHSIHLFPLHFSARASPCATRFRFHSTHICYSLSRSQGHSAAARIMSVINFNGTIWYRRVIQYNTGFCLGKNNNSLTSVSCPLFLNVLPTDSSVEAS